MIGMFTFRNFINFMFNCVTSYSKYKGREKGLDLAERAPQCMKKMGFFK